MPLELADHVLAAAYAVILPALLLSSARHGPGQGEEGGELVAMAARDKVLTLVANAVFLWVLTAPVLGLWWWRDRPWESLGVRATETGAAAWWLLAGLVVWLIVDTGWQVATPTRRAATSRRWRRDTPQMPATAGEVVASLPLVVSAAICEELLYRGFLLGYAASLLAGVPAGDVVAVIVLGVVFGLMHRYQGRARMLKTMVLAVGMGALYLLTGSLLLPIALHFAIDFVMMLLAPSLMRPTRDL